METYAPLLAPEAFRAVVQATPLVSIDLLVRDADGRMLVGRRTNPPARGYWFVPGGRIRKGETLAQAFARITLAELGTAFALEASRFAGVYEHFYAEDFTGATGAGTHYVVLAHALAVDAAGLRLPTDQHDGYRWTTAHEAVADESVHANTRAYFPDGAAR